MLRSYLLVAKKSQNSKPIYSLATLQPSSLKDFLTISESSWRGLVRSNDKSPNIGLWKCQNVQNEILLGKLTASSADREQILLVLSLSNALRCNLHKNGRGRGLFIWWENALQSHTKIHFFRIATPYNESLDSNVPVILRSIRPFRGQDRVKQTSSAKFHDHL